MLKKIAILLFSVLLVVSALAACSGNKKNTASESPGGSASSSGGLETEQLKGEIEIWHWDAQSVERALPDFNKKYPDIKVTVVNKPGDYVNNLRTAVASGLDLPDMVMMDISFRGELMDWGIFEDLSQAPYNLKDDVFLDYIRPTLYNSKGELITIPWDLGLAGMVYNKAAAKKWLGTDDKDELEAKLSTWDAFAAVGKEVHDKSGGSAFMFASAPPLGLMVYNQDKTPVIQDGKANFDATIKKSFETFAKIRDAGAVDVIKEWTPGFYASITSDDHIFTIGPPWFVSFTMEPNAPDSNGKFGLMVPPEGGSMNGGAGVAILKKNKSDQQKLLAWKFLEWFLVSEEGAKVQREQNNFYIHVKSAYDDPTYKSFRHPLFGDQDLGEVWFGELADKLELRPTTAYDRFIMGAQAAGFQQLVENPALTAEEAYKAFKQAYNQNDPAIKAE